MFNKKRKVKVFQAGMYDNRLSFFPSLSWECEADIMSIWFFEFLFFFVSLTFIDEDYIEYINNDGEGEE